MAVTLPSDSGGSAVSSRVLKDSSLGVTFVSPTWDLFLSVVRFFELVRVP